MQQITEPKRISNIVLVGTVKVQRTSGLCCYNAGVEGGEVEVGISIMKIISKRLLLAVPAVFAISCSGEAARLYPGPCEEIWTDLETGWQRITRNQYKDDRIVSSDHSMFNGAQDLVWQFVEEYEYDADGRLVSVTASDPSTPDPRPNDYRRTYAYNAAGQLTMETYRSWDYELTSFFYFYNTDGTIAEEITILDWACSLDGKIYRYNDDGLVVKIVSYWGPPTCGLPADLSEPPETRYGQYYKEVCEEVFEYDERGFLVARHGCDIDVRYENNENGYPARKIYSGREELISYDSFGNKISEVTTLGDPPVVKELREYKYDCFQ
ncbi:MAG: hypothetical protein D6800_01500 [Candidatus Zixiibacteriota bacterium]|nr:MAG: hypothetical protein D6800_01500 [candidate division Zixibacteria bacterium]